MNQFTKFNIFILSALGAFAIAMGMTIVRGDFKKPTEGPPALNIIPFLDAGSSAFQRKAGTLRVKDLYDPFGGAISARTPAVEIVTSAQDYGQYATVFCSPGFKLLNCSGARERTANYQTCNEDDCEFSGAVPVVRCPSGTTGPADGEVATSTICYDANFNPIFTPANGCRAGIDPVPGGIVGTGNFSAATVHAYCVSSQ